MKFTLTLFCVILSLIAGSFALPATNDLVSLSKRNNDVCKCEVFIADFTSQYDKRHDSPGVVGIMTFSQQEDCTIVTGIFKHGFEDVHEEPRFTINDHCGNELFVLEGLGVEPTADGGTKSFKQVYKNLKIDCGPDSVFARDASASCGSSKRKRQSSGPSVSGVPPNASLNMKRYPS